jgi:hypothetical protein
LAVVPTPLLHLHLEDYLEITQASLRPTFSVAAALRLLLAVVAVCLARTTRLRRPLLQLLHHLAFSETLRLALQLLLSQLSLYHLQLRLEHHLLILQSLPVDCSATQVRKHLLELLVSSVERSQQPRRPLLLSPAQRLRHQLAASSEVHSPEAALLPEVCSALSQHRPLPLRLAGYSVQRPKRRHLLLPHKLEAQLLLPLQPQCSAPSPQLRQLAHRPRVACSAVAAQLPLRPRELQLRRQLEVCLELSLRQPQLLQHLQLRPRVLVVFSAALQSPPLNHLLPSRQVVCLEPLPQVQQLPHLRLLVHQQLLRLLHRALLLLLPAASLARNRLLTPARMRLSLHLPVSLLGL